MLLHLRANTICSDTMNDPQARGSFTARFPMLLRMKVLQDKRRRPVPLTDFICPPE